MSDDTGPFSCPWSQLAHYDYQDTGLGWSSGGLDDHGVQARGKIKQIDELYVTS